MEGYLSPLDTVANLSAGSLQHHGSYALSLSRHFGQQDLTRLKRGGDDVFFNLLGSSFFVYGEGWVLPGELIVSALLLGAIVTGVRRSEVRVSRVLLGLLPSVALLLVIPVVLAAVAWLYIRIFSARMIVSDSVANAWLLTGFALLGACAGVAMLAAFARRFSAQELTLSGLIVICALSWALALALPGGSYLLFQPLLLMTLGVLGAMLVKRVTPQPYGVEGLAATGGARLPVFSVASTVYMFFSRDWSTASTQGLLLA